MDVSTATAFKGLRAFQLDGVQDTGRTIGEGSFASVKELNFRSLKCAGKRLHDIIYNLADPRAKQAVVERFASECELLSGLHHPCIVQFLGVYFEEEARLPILVMEYLHTTLSACIDRYGILQDEIIYSILYDVALGLRYLHEHWPPIIHRDLSANNVLLTPDMSAKISDLGVAKILNLSPAQMGLMTQTQMPGTPCYMPPEVMVARPKYTSKVDIFSYGVLIVHLLSGQWPIPGEAFQEDPNNPDTSVPVSEFNRRAEYLEKVSLDHSLMKLIRQCLSNTHTRRPEAKEVATSVGALVADHPPSLENRVEMLQKIQSLGSEVDRLEGEVEGLQREVDTLREEGASVRGEMEALQAQVERLAATRGKNQPSLEWSQCADLPVGMSSLQSVVVGGKVYVGGGTTYNRGDLYQLFSYTPKEDQWSALPPCPVAWFALCEFQGNLVTVGGFKRGHEITGELFCYKKESREWEGYLKPMPTARTLLTAVTTESAIVACGGKYNADVFSIVEVYRTETKHWYTVDPLPFPWTLLTSVCVGDTCYLLGGKEANSGPTKSAVYASLSLLIEAAASPRVGEQSTQMTGKYSVWKSLPNAPLKWSTASCLDGNLLAVGGNGLLGTSPDIHMFSRELEVWIRVGNKLPTDVYASAVASLPEGKLLVCGGLDGEDSIVSSVYCGQRCIGQS